ncbi:MAG: AAA family ATPase [Lachnospiraceae bacterium]|nr:AAA family ATPase [Lachnospiraceae bacterium]
MSEDALTEYLKKGEVEDAEKVAKDLIAAKELLTDKELDMNLLKNGLQIVMTKRAGDAVIIADYGMILMGYDDSVQVSKLITDALDTIPEDELAVFKQGSKLADIVAYSKTIDSIFANREPEKASGSQTDDEPAEPKGLKMPEFFTRHDEDKTAEKSIEIYSDVLAGYLDNLKKIIPAFKAGGNEKLLWSQSLLISIDDGNGLSTFLKALSRIYVESGLAYPKGEELIMKMKIGDTGGRDDRYHDWDVLVEAVEKITRYSDDDNKLQRIIDIDISRWTAELNTSRIKDYLISINDANPHVLFIFRVPYMEYRIVHDINNSISDIIKVRPLIVPPADSEHMLKYIRIKAARYGYSFAEDCDDLLEQGIVAEKNDGSFYGYRSVAKMVESILYDRISEEAESEEKAANKEITLEELKRYLNVSVDDRSSEELIAGMIGVEPIIEQVNTLINQIKVQQKMAENGKSLDRPTIHMCFTGSPGTGKTTIARIIAKKMKEEGILSKGNFYEIKGRDLCGAYIGETTPKTSGYCRAAYGSVLFIDEAYELFRSANDSKDYGREAITALIAEMENHRDDMCVIMAGYTDEMKNLLESNPGLKSRIRSIIEFPNYSRSELEQIFMGMVGDSFYYDDAFKKAVHKYFDGLEDEVIEDKTFANGRFVRNLYENTWGNAALRNEFDDTGRLKLKATDFTTSAEKTDATGTDEPKRRPMGFGAF